MLFSKFAVELIFLYFNNTVFSLITVNSTLYFSNKSQTNYVLVPAALCKSTPIHKEECECFKVRCG